MARCKSRKYLQYHLIDFLQLSYYCPKRGLQNIPTPISHYFIVADDMLLNPLLTEDNLWDVTGLRKDECFITELIDMQKKKEAWPRVYDAIMWNFNVWIA